MFQILSCSLTTNNSRVIQEGRYNELFLSRLNPLLVSLESSGLLSLLRWQMRLSSTCWSCSSASFPRSLFPSSTQSNGSCKPSCPTNWTSPQRKHFFSSLAKSYLESTECLSSRDCLPYAELRNEFLRYVHKILQSIQGIKEFEKLKRLPPFQLLKVTHTVYSINLWIVNVRLRSFEPEL